MRARVLPASLAPLLLGLVLATGCVGTRPAEPPPDEQFGHRYEEGTPDGRDVIVITPPDSAAEYFYYPAIFDTVHIRPASLAADVPAEGQAVPVELLLKGSLPDACMQLHAVAQQRVGHLIDVTLRMRRPQGAVCAAVVRPYRFYLMLEGEYGVGSYTLKINDRVYTFEVRSPV